jgi:hypothetical protein
MGDLNVNFSNFKGENYVLKITLNIIKPQSPKEK